MSQFVARVELCNGGSAEDYENLHQAMQLKGFGRTIVGSDSVEYNLPDAMYFQQSNAVRSYVLKQIQEAAASVGYPAWAEDKPKAKSARCIVSQGHSAWGGLEKS